MSHFKLTLNNEAGELNSITVDNSALIKEGLIQLINETSEFYDGDNLTVEETED